MIGLLRADWRKLRHRWMPRILLLILIGLVTLIFALLTTHGHNRNHMALPGGFVAALDLVAGFAPFIWPVLAGSWAGGEYSWGTIRVVLTRQPSRMAVALSGLIVVVATVVVGVILAVVVAAIVASTLGAGNTAAPTPNGVNATAVIIKLFLAACFTSSFYVVLAYTAGTVFRSVPAGIGIGIGFSVAQSITAGIFTALGDPWRSIAQHFPDGYAEALTSRVGTELVRTGPFGRGTSSSASIPEALIGLAVYIAILLGVTLFVVRMRDVTA